MIFENRHIVLGVTGGIAAYKSAELCRIFRRGGAEVQAIMSANAAQFVTPLTFATLSQHPVCVSLFDSNENWEMDHISHAKWGDLLVVAPATANIIGKFAQGVADDALSTLYLAWEKPVLIAPAMNPNMWSHAAVEENVTRLVERGVEIVGPGRGDTACGDEGWGRMCEAAEIAQAAEHIFERANLLADKRVLITSGPTREYIDPVRFISNPSSGKMGAALAQEAMLRGAEVTLVSGPSRIALNSKIKRIDVESAQQMYEAVLGEWKDQDILIFAAAVGDYRPAENHANKLKKTGEEMSLRLEPTVDIAKEIGMRASASGDRKRILVGFAAETEDLESNARKKLEAKQLDLIVANDVSPSGGAFGSDENSAIIFSRSSEPVRLERRSKRLLAGEILDSVRRTLE